MEDKRFVIAIEVSSSRIIGVAASLEEDNNADVVCCEEEEINGPVIYGVIKNVDEVATKINAILRRIEKNQKVAPRRIESVYVGINARSLHSVTVTVDKPINENIPIDEALMRQILHESCAGIDKDAYMILDTRMRLCEIDGKETLNPVGALGSNISVSTTAVICNKRICNSIKMAFDRLGIGIKDFIPTQLALSNLALTSDERRLGCMLVDFGSDTTAVSIYKNDRLMYLNTLPMGSRNITRDLTSLNILPENAELIKRTYGIMPLADAAKTEFAQDVSSTDVVNYISARAGEIIENIINQLKIADIKAEQLPGGIVAVGRGTKMKGFNELLEKNSKLRVRKIGGSESYSDNIGSLAIVDYASNIAGKEGSCVVPPKMPEVEEEPVKQQEETVKEKNKKGKEEKKGSFFSRLVTKINTGIDPIFGGDDDEE